tara:strand:- start:9227 stop:11011 length:1785 start_codon:yes stop_codon:yes gene_type:complete
MVAVYNDDFEYVGTVEGMDWTRLKDYTLIAHNASFDQRVFERLQEIGEIPNNVGKKWICTADMCCYFQYQRNLKGAAKEILGVEMDKGIRDNLKGLDWEDLSAQDMVKDTYDYALNDARYCFQIWDKLYPDWPLVERRASEINRDMGWEGLPCNPYDMEIESDKMSHKSFNARKRLPWYEQIDPDTKKPYAIYSKKALALECRRRGIPVPKSLDKKNKDFLAWNEEYGEIFTCATDMQEVQRINKHSKTLDAMIERIFEDRIKYQTKYFGASITGRFSGTDGLNVQNLPVGSKHGLNLRGCIRAHGGKSFVSVDYSNIEARVTPWVAGDTDTLDLIREGLNPYEVHARLTMGWEGGSLKKEDPELYTLAKVRVLQLGYGSGWAKFADTVKLFEQQHVLDREFSLEDEARFKKFAGTYQPGKASLYPTLSTYDRRQWINAYLQVDDFRQKNPNIVCHWKTHDKLFKQAANHGRDYQIPMFSGRLLKYFRCRHESDGTTAAEQMGSPRRHYFYGANLFQNVVQATARDLFVDAMVRLHEAGFKVVMHVHDEVLVEVDEADAQESLDKVIEIMSTPPSWAEELPLAAEGQITKEYTK